MYIYIYTDTHITRLYIYAWKERERERVSSLLLLLVGSPHSELTALLPRHIQERWLLAPLAQYRGRLCFRCECSYLVAGLATLYWNEPRRVKMSKTVATTTTRTMITPYIEAQSPYHIGTWTLGGVDWVIETGSQSSMWSRHPSAHRIPSRPHGHLVSALNLEYL